MCWLIKSNHTHFTAESNKKHCVDLKFIYVTDNIKGQILTLCYNKGIVFLYLDWIFSFEGDNRYYIAVNVVIVG